MKFAITRASDNYGYSNVKIKDFSSIESLIDFMERVGEDLVIKRNTFYKEKIHYIKRWYPFLDADIVTIPYEIEICDEDEYNYIYEE